MLNLLSDSSMVIQGKEVTSLNNYTILDYILLSMFWSGQMGFMFPLMHKTQVCRSAKDL